MWHLLGGNDPFLLATSWVYAGDDLDGEIDNLLGGVKTVTNEKAAAVSENSSGIIDRASLPNIYIAADFTGEFDINHRGDNRATRNAFMVREVEIGLSGGIDWLAMGFLSLAVHNEEGKYIWELHEVYFEFNNLPWNLWARGGRFFLDAGRLNGIHRHDWHFTSTPKVHEEFFDNEGVYDQGGEIAFLMPFSFYQEIKLGIFNGRTWGHTHGDGPLKPVPLLTARLKNFVSFGNNWGSHFGFTYIHFSPNEGVSGDADHTAGADLTIKWNRGRYRGFIFSTEYWFRYRQRETAEEDKSTGLYGYMQYQFHHYWAVGTRYDFFSEELDSNVKKFSNGVVLWITFKPSEFSYFRINLEGQDYFGERKNVLLYLQADFILGHHPPHKY